MRILDVQHAVPSRAVSNDDVVERLLAVNRSRFDRDELATLETRWRRFLAHAGARDRFVLDDGEHAIDIALTAARAVLAGHTGPVAFVLFAGVARG